MLVELFIGAVKNNNNKNVTHSITTLNIMTHSVNKLSLMTHITMTPSIIIKM